MSNLSKHSQPRSYKKIKKKKDLKIIFGKFLHEPYFDDLMSNSAFLSNESHNLKKYALSAIPCKQGIKSKVGEKSAAKKKIIYPPNE